MYKKILLAIDGSENSLRAAVEAARLAKTEPQSTVEILYVNVPPKTAREILLEPSKEEQEKAQRNKIKPVEEILDEHNINHKTTILVGDVAYSIVHYANDNHFELVVIGSRGLNAVQKLVLGGVSNTVMNKVHCPILLVK